MSTRKGDGVFASLRDFDDVDVEKWPTIVPSEPSVSRAAFQVCVLIFMFKSSDLQAHIRHSCDPNCWFEFADRRMMLDAIPAVVARRDIAPGEEITIGSWYRWVPKFTIWLSVLCMR